MEQFRHQTYWQTVWQQFRKKPLGIAALVVLAIFCLAGIYAPFLASSKPLFVSYEGEWYFPLFRYLFYRGFYTKLLDIFFNLLMFTLPAYLLLLFLFKHSKWIISALFILTQIGLFLYFAFGPVKDPAHNSTLNLEKQKFIQSQLADNQDRLKTWESWDFELRHMTPYGKLNLLVQYKLRKEQNTQLVKQLGITSLPTLWQIDQNHLNQQITNLNAELVDHGKAHEEAQAKLRFIQERSKWLEKQSNKLHFTIMPFLSHFHWEDDAGGNQWLNQQVKWWQVTRNNRKDLISALIFGIRISLVVGIVSVAIALLIGIPVGAYAGFYGGALDIAICRLLEIWEAMPTFFMLLLIVAMTQSKSIFLVISVIGIFGWTGFCRFLRGEFFKQRNLPYVEACRSLGFRDPYIIFSHILPNAIPPLLTLAPFAIMSAISSEAGLSFLGLGEEGSCSWGVLMDEGRNAFPAASYLLWPPAILLTILLVAIALVGDALRDALDPKMHIAYA